MLPKMRFLLCMVLAVFFAVGSFGSLHADERILEYHSDIVVHLDGSMTVTERIVVRSEQDEIRRGIYRDFPTRYRDSQGNHYTVDFRMLSAYRDGVTENFFTRKLPNGLRIFLGEENRLLPPGEHVYEISYHTTRQLGFYEERDELYWNSTGNGWSFPIDHATATVLLPEQIPRDLLRTDFYTGPQGSTGKDATAAVAYTGAVQFETSSELPPGHGLTIVVSWPAGVISRPTALQTMEYFLADNRGVLLLSAGFLVIFFYYFSVWRHVGRDPEPGPLFPHYRPPAQLSPAATRYVMKMGADSRGYSAALVSMAVKGYLRIVETGSEYRLERMPGVDDSQLSSGERRMARELFKNSKTLRLENSNHARISAAQNGLKKALRAEYGKGFFSKNRVYFIPGLLLSLVATIASAALSTQGQAEAVFMTIWLLAWTMVVSFLIVQRQIFMALVFGFFEVVACVAFFQLVGLAHVALVIALAGMNFVFFELLKAPTSLGRRLMDEIEGFAMYLRIAEGDRLKELNPSGEAPPQRTVGLFEQFLPFAIALDVEQQWADQFTDVLKSASIKEDYHPRWYLGSNWDPGSPGKFGSTLGRGFAGAISSAAVAPGTSSGSGGGGFSGGGGGGGGGGGW